MGMNIDGAGQDESTRRVDRFVNIGPDGRLNADYLVTFNKHIRLSANAAKYNCAALN
jgi:hypothetical protein